MTTGLYDYPKSSAYGRVLPKSKIYQYANPGSSVKDLFVRQVDKIVWKHKLSPETINLKATRAVPEIQIMSIALKGAELKPEVLRCIDHAIPLPILFELHSDGKVKSVAAYKRPYEADDTKWTFSEYFEGTWVSADSPRDPLPMVSNLEALYECLLNPLMPYPARSGEGLSEWVGRMECIRLKKRELERCESRLRKEKQFNRKVAVNAEVRDLKQELDNLTGSLPAGDSSVGL